MSAPTVAVRLSHPYGWHDPLDVLELDAATAALLVRSGVARRLDDLISPAGGGMFDVELATPRRVVRVRGAATARRTLEENAP